jgi:hypothetical protein
VILGIAYALKRMMASPKEPTEGYGDKANNMESVYVH